MIYEEESTFMESSSKPLLLSSVPYEESRQNSVDCIEITEFSRSAYRILLVEDNEFNRKIIQSMLLKLGLRVPFSLSQSLTPH